MKKLLLSLLMTSTIATTYAVVNYIDPDAGVQRGAERCREYGMESRNGVCMLRSGDIGCNQDAHCLSGRCNPQEETVVGKRRTVVTRKCL